MKKRTNRLQPIVKNPLHFVTQVVSQFRANQGFLLSGAVAYYTLLSIVPMFAVVLIALSQLTDTQQLLETAAAYLKLVAPGQSTEIAVQIEIFLVNWKVVGAVGLLILLFFSSLAFTSLENAMSVIFHHRVAIKRRHFLISAIIPFVYILLLAMGLFTVSAISAALHTFDERTITIFGRIWSLGGVNTVTVYILGVFGEVVLLTSLYMVMPVGRLSIRHAMIGGVTATILWEITRHFLTWYFSTLSLVNVVYGSFASAIVILLSCEAAALILLLGAQVIATYEQHDEKSIALQT